MRLFGGVARGLWWLDRVIDAALVLTVAAAAVVMLVQVAMRYLLAAPLTWAEEFAVLAFGWMTFLGAAYTQRTRSDIAVDSLRNLAGPRLGAALDALRWLGIAVAAGVLIVQGTRLTAATWSLEYPAMGLPRGLLYLAVPVGFGLVVIELLRQVAARLELVRGELTSPASSRPKADRPHESASSRPKADRPQESPEAGPP